jgi:hypothetical protein
METFAVNPVRMAAVTTVTLALLMYTVGTLKEQRTRHASPGARGFLTLGVLLDLTATTLMVVATGKLALTLHGALGYSALALMLIDTVLLWRHWRVSGPAEVGRGLHLFARVAYIYWVAAYVTGAALVMANRAA